MHTHKSITIPVPAKAERKRNELFMEEKRFVEFARELGLQCDQDFLETYERRKALFPFARVVWPRRLEERAYLHHISNDMRPLSMLTKSKEYRPYLEFSEIQSLISSGFGFLSPSHSDLIDAITKEGHPISRSLRGNLTPGVVQRPEEKPFRAWKNWQFSYSGGVHLNRAQHYYGWWQVLEVYALEFINLQIENPAWRIQNTDIDKRFLKAGRWCFLHGHVNPPRRIDFNPSNAPLEEIWPGAWSAWLPWIERAADFDWRSYVSLQCYLFQVDQRGGSDCEWDLHLQREQDAAKNLTEGTCTEEWVRLLRALCRFEEHLAKEERLLLRLVVHNIMRTIADLLYVAFNMNTRELALEHDGAARQGYEGGLCSVDGEAVRP